MKANNHIDPAKAGYSDIRLWPCYGVLAFTTLALTPFIGFFSALFFAGLPLFVGSIFIVGVTRSDSKIPKRWNLPRESAVYAEIEKKEREFERENHLLRRNMKIIQEDEQDIKQKKKHVTNKRTKLAQ